VKKWLVSLLVTFLCLVFAASGFAVGTTYNGYPVVKLIVNGKTVNSDVPAIIMDGRTLVPARAIAEALGYEAVFEQDTYTVKIDPRKQVYGSTRKPIPQTYYFKSSVIPINENRTYSLVIMDGEAYVELAFFGTYSVYDGKQATISIPGRGTVIVPRGQKYEPGIEGHSAYGQIMVKLSSFGLKASIIEEPSITDSTYKPGTVIIEAVD
jgi:hypothetical protein